MFEQVDWAGMLFFTRLAVVISGIFDHSEEMEGEWRIEFREEAGDVKFLPDREVEKIILLRKLVG